MERGVLQVKSENGEKVDFIPYVDALAVKIAGSNLQEYMEQVNTSLEKLSLFKGPFESEEQLLEKYPNGENYSEGLMAIVSDTDSIYLYDTETLKWIKTSANITGILQINGLNAINGILTLTGGNINSTVPSAETNTQTITEHLDKLYQKAKTAEYQSYGLMAFDYGWEKPEVDDNYVTLCVKVYSHLKNAKLIITELRKPDGMSSDQYDKLVKVKITYSDNETKTNFLYSADKNTLKYRDLVNFQAVNIGSVEPFILIYCDPTQSYLSLIGLNKNINNRIITTYSLNHGTWSQNEDESGYTYTITAGKSSLTSTYNVLSVYKNNGNKRTTAIVDYVIENNIITLYSDEAFDGGVTITYVYY